jgi:hypothetical protein
VIRFALVSIVTFFNTEKEHQLFQILKQVQNPILST